MSTAINTAAVGRSPNVPGPGWSDLNVEREWGVRTDDGDLRPLVGLAPDSFDRLGWFESHADLTRGTTSPDGLVRLRQLALIAPGT